MKADDALNRAQKQWYSDPKFRERYVQTIAKRFKKGTYERIRAFLVVEGVNMKLSGTVIFHLPSGRWIEMMGPYEEIGSRLRDHPDADTALILRILTV